MPMVNNDMCSQIKGDAGESRICAGGKRGEGVCDVRITNTSLQHETKTTRMQLECTSLKSPFHPNNMETSKYLVSTEGIVPIKMVDVKFVGLS